jgi:hypothetical protein
VASTGIEPVSGASETHILSIVLRGQTQYNNCAKVNAKPLLYKLILAENRNSIFYFILNEIILRGKQKVIVFLSNKMINCLR